MTGLCDRPCRTHYQRGCRCAGCVEANAAFKKEWRRKKALESGRVYGEKPCARCDLPISVLDSSNRKKYCETCAPLVLKDWRKADRQRRDQRPYLREYYRANKDRLLRRQREYNDEHRQEIRERSRQYHIRNAASIRARLRAKYAKKDTPTVHERALEAFNFRSSEGGTGGGFRLRRCGCGCGMWVNAAHVAVVRLFNLGYSRQEIAARLGVHLSEVSQLKLDGEARAWPWYRRGHGNLSGLKSKPVSARRRVSKDIELRLLIEQQEVESAFGPRQKTTTGKSLDAVIGGTEGFRLVDTIAAPVGTGDFTDTEESLFDWLVRNGIDLDDLAERCRADRALADALAESTELGHPTSGVIDLLAASRLDIAS